MSSPTPEDAAVIKALLASETSQDRPAKKRRKLVKAGEVQEPLQELPSASKSSVGLLLQEAYCHRLKTSSVTWCFCFAAITGTFHAGVQTLSKLWCGC